MSTPYMRVCADPFNAPAVGIPDEYEGLTVPFKLRTAINATTNAAGAFLVAFTGRLDGSSTDSYSNVATAATATTITAFAGTDHPDLTSFSANFRTYRPVSAGIKVYYTGAESTTAGILTVGHLEGLATTTVDGKEWPLDISDWVDLPGAYTHSCAAMTEPLMAVARCYDRPGFASPSTIINQYFPSLFVSGLNLPASSTVVRIEAVLNLECVPYVGNQVSQHLSSVTAPNTSHMEMTSRRLATTKVGPASTLARNMLSLSSMVSKRKKRPSKKRRKRKLTYPTAAKYSNSTGRLSSMIPVTYRQVPRGVRRPGPSIGSGIRNLRRRLDLDY